MAAGDAESEVLVKKALEDFLRKHDGEASLSYIDEIVLSYMVSILEELGNDDAGEDAFDVEAFTDMMQGFMPEFASIDSIAITEWMFELAGTLCNKPQNGGASLLSFCPPQSAAIATPDKKPQQQQQQHKREHKMSSSSCTSLTESSPRSSVSASSAPSASSVEDDSATTCRLLLEMFPGTCRLEVTHCLSTAEGDVEMAAQLLLHRQDTGDAITEDRVQPVLVNGKKHAARNDEDMKKHIVNKYSFVDTEDDKRDHRPLMPKKESKKLVRYRNNQVVSTKGERFSEIKKSPEEEERMKKTFVSLKPAKQYRFH